MALQIIDIQIRKDSSTGKSAVLERLSRFLCEKFKLGIEARQQDIEQKMTQYESNYMAIPKQATRTTPFYNASNFVPGLIRMHTDIMHARIMGYMFGVKPFWMPKFFSSRIKHEWLDGLAEWMEYKSFYDMDFFEPVDQAMLQTVKLGTTVLKADWVEKAKYLASGMDTYKPFTTKRQEINPILYQDFVVYPMTARNLKRAQVKFARLRYTKEQIEFFKATAGWDKGAVDKLLTMPVSMVETATQKLSNFSGIFLKPDISRPYHVVEAWLDYELETGKLMPLVVVFNPQITGSEAILRAYHNPYPDPELDPFIDLRIFPKADSFYGDCIPRILEQSQEEQAQIHNSRRDANLIANCPGWKKKRYAEGVGNPSQEWYPGKVWELDAMDDLEPLLLQANYNSLVEEENALLALAERYSGNPPPTQGFGSGSQGKRGVYNSQGTLALLSEGNRRLDLILKRVRTPFHKLGRLTYSSYKNFGDEAQMYTQDGDQDGFIQQALSLPQGYDGVFFELAASDASANREVERSSLLLMANTMASYYGQITQAMQYVFQSPAGSPVQELILSVLDGARDLANRVLYAFNIEDRKRLLPDLRSVLGGKQPGNGPAAPGGAGMPQPEGDVQQSDLQSLSETVAQIAQASGRASNGAQGNGGGRPS